MTESFHGDYIRSDAGLEKFIHCSWAQTQEAKTIKVSRPALFMACSLTMFNSLEKRLLKQNAFESRRWTVRKVVKYNVQNGAVTHCKVNPFSEYTKY